MCMRLAVIIRLILSLFSQIELSHIFLLKSYKHYVSCGRNAYSFSRISLKLCRCFLLFGCNRQIIFTHFFSQFELSHFCLKHVDTRNLVSATPTV